jgi:hypothetical protein
MSNLGAEGRRMTKHFQAEAIMFRNLKDFLTDNANRINKHAKAMAHKFGRPIQYLAVPTRKEDLARKMAEEEGIQRCLVCIFYVLELCRTFSLKFQKGGLHLQHLANHPKKQSTRVRRKKSCNRRGLGLPRLLPHDSGRNPVVL